MSIPECFLLDLEHFFYINLKAVPYSIVKRFFVLFFSLELNSHKDEKSLQGMELQEKEKVHKKDNPKEPKGNAQVF